MRQLKRRGSVPGELVDKLVEEALVSARLVLRVDDPPALADDPADEGYAVARATEKETAPVSTDESE